MPINSCVKGKRAEIESAHAWADTFGVPMCRGQQHAGGADSPDIKGQPGVHIEVKRVEKLNLENAMAQSIAESGAGEVPIVLHRKNRGQWLVTVPLEWLPMLTSLLETQRIESQKCDGCGYSPQQCERAKSQGFVKCCPDCDHGNVVPA